MIIFVKSLTWRTLSLEVESFDTVDYVKELLKKKEGFIRSDYELTFCCYTLEDSKTLASCGIQKESTLHMKRVTSGGVHVYIKHSLGKIVVRVENQDKIDDVKAQIGERMGIAVNKHRIFFGGKEIEDGGRSVDDCRIRNGSTLLLVLVEGGDDAVDITAVQARRKEALSECKGTGNRAEVVVGSKRALEDCSSASLSPKRVLLACGVNNVAGVESFWDEEDHGLALRKSKYLISPYDTSRFKSKSRLTLIESVANDCARTLNVTTFLESQLQEYEDKLSEAENNIRKEKESLEKAKQELDEECKTGASFLKSVAGRRHIVNLERQAAKCGVEDFKKSGAFKELVMGRAVSVYDDAVKECQKLLRKSGRVSEDVIDLLDLKLKNDDEDEEEMNEGDHDWTKMYGNYDEH